MYCQLGLSEVRAEQRNRSAYPRSLLTRGVEQLLLYMGRISLSSESIMINTSLPVFNWENKAVFLSAVAKEVAW